MRGTRQSFLGSFLGLLLPILLFAAGGSFDPAYAQQQEKRIALVVGNGAYAKTPLATTANDAGLIAQTLQAAGFDVVGARDLDGDTLRSCVAGPGKERQKEFTAKEGSGQTLRVFKRVKP